MCASKNSNAREFVNAIFSREVARSIAQVGYVFQAICASRNLKYYFQGFCASRNSNTTCSKGTYAFKSPKCSKEFVPPRAHDTTFSRQFVPSSACRAHPSSSNSADHWLHSCHSRWPKFGTPHSQNLAVKGCCFVPRCGICGGFFMKFLVATFNGN